MTHIASLRWFRREIHECNAGDAIGLFVPVDARTRRGTLLAAPRSQAFCSRFAATIRWGTLPPPAAAFCGRMGAQLFIEGCTVDAVLLKSGRRPVRGEHFHCEVEVRSAVPVEVGARFVLHSDHEHLAIGAVHRVLDRPRG